MTRTRQPRRAARAPARRRAAIRPALWALVRKHVVPNLVFAVPAYFASRFIQHLGGGALWFPRQWRETVGIFGLLIGLAAFNLARSNVRVRGRARPAARSRGGEKEESGAHGSRVRLRSLGCYALALVFLGGYVLLRHHCVRSWSPRLEWLALHGVTSAGAEGLPSFIELAPQPSVRAREPGAEPGPVEVWRGSFLVPLRFSAGTRAALAAIEREQGRDPILYSLECNEEWLIDRIEHHEQLWMALTTIVFFAVHMGVLVFACFGFGCEFSAPEELASELARLV